MAGLKPSALKALLQSGDYSDFTIRCKGSQFKVHKVILGVGSQFFSSLFRSQCKEMLENAVDLPEDDPDTIGRLIDSLYLGHYLSRERPVSMGGPPHAAPIKSPLLGKRKGGPFTKDLTCLRNDILVCLAANKFGMPMTKAQAFETIKIRIGSMSIRNEGLADVLELLFQGTETGDLVRNFIVRQAIDSDEDATPDDIVKVIMRHEPTAWAVARSLKYELDDAKAELEEARQEEF